MIYLIIIKNGDRFEEMRNVHAKRNFSAKREAIYKLLVSAKNHPTAEWVYESLKPEIPDLSLGTVYRNISVFREMGLIKSIGIFNGQERFDADMSQHSHFICTECFTLLWKKNVMLRLKVIILFFMVYAVCVIIHTNVKWLSIS